VKAIVALAPGIGSVAGELVRYGFGAEVAQPFAFPAPNDGDAPIEDAIPLKTKVVKIFLVLGPGDAIVGHALLPHTDVKPFIFCQNTVPFPFEEVGAESVL
jgi:hypothetical protein